MREREGKQRKSREEGRNEGGRERRKERGERFSRSHLWTLVTRFEVRPGLNCYQPSLRPNASGPNAWRSKVLGQIGDQSLRELPRRQSIRAITGL